MRIGQIPGTAVSLDDLHRHARRQMFFEMFFHQLQNRGAVLVGHQSKSQLRHRMTGDDRFGPLPLVTAADAVDLGGWSRPESLQCAEPFFPEERGRTGLIKNLLVRLDRKLAPRFALPILERLDLIVKSFDRDVSICRRATSRAVATGQ